jgi:hypothetical protein
MATIRALLSVVDLSVGEVVYPPVADWARDTSVTWS